MKQVNAYSPRNIVAFILLMLMLSACSNKKGNQQTEDNEQQKATEQHSSNSKFSGYANAIFSIETYDQQRILEKGKGFLVNTTTVVAPFSLFRDATRAVLTPINGGVPIEVTNYYSFDRINDVILLELDNSDAEPLKLYGGSTIKLVKTTIVAPKINNRQPLYAGTCLEERVIQGRKLYAITNMVGKVSNGTPVLVSNGSVLGMGITEEVSYEKQNFAVPATEIYTLINRNDIAKPLLSIKTGNSSRNSKVKRIVLVTEYGNIEIKLYNETPAYRDNFIQLAEEGFYDSLLIHRVIRDFGIQTGAADTRHAKADDIVGWKGPGYTVPAHIIPELYHKRGAIGSPRKPDDKNHNRRSDGSQFYIVSGRPYTDIELDDLEKKNNIKFTAKQREVYKTVGGSPHLDGSYTVFGEVISGLEVADRISRMPVHGDFRPLVDIRLKKVIVEF